MRSSRTTSFEGSGTLGRGPNGDGGPVWEGATVMAEAGVNPQSQPLGFAPFGTLQYPLAHSQMQGVQGPAMGGSPYEQQQVMHHGHPMSLHAPSTMAGWPAYPQQVMPPFYGAYGGPVWHPQQQPQIHANGHHTIETSAVLSAQGWVQSHAGLYSDPRNAGTPHVKTTTQHLLLHDNMSPLQPVVDAQQRQVPMIQLKGEEPARAETLRRRTERVVVMDPDSGQPILINSFKSTQTPEQRAAMASRKRVYECPFCGHLFASSSNLIRHKRVHTGDRPYKCALCPATFGSSSNRNAHERTCKARPPTIEPDRVSEISAAVAAATATTEEQEAVLRTANGGENELTHKVANDDGVNGVVSSAVREVKFEARDSVQPATASVTSQINQFLVAAASISPENRATFAWRGEAPQAAQQHDPHPHMAQAHTESS